VCGNCAGSVSAGSVSCLSGGAHDEATGQHLFCQCTPQGDVEIAPVSFRHIDPAARKTFAVKVYRNQRAANDVNVLQLRLPAGQRAKFKAGQYLQVVLADGSRRCYSMANAPHESDTLTLHVRHVPDGHFTRIVPTLAAGDMLQVELPYGNFERREDSNAPLVFVAGGTGFAPVKAILDDAVKRGIHRQVTLLWGARRRDGLYLMAAVQRWQRLLPDFRFIAAVDDANDAAALQPPAFVGSLDAALRAHCPDLRGHEVYCCGAPAMVAAVRRSCVEERHLDPRDFFSDAFVLGPAAQAA
jgi:CDP-4-dehydro-6-deoxyglucose reductase/terephthalate 1,2-dioxygenase reductase component